MRFQGLSRNAYAFVSFINDLLQSNNGFMTHIMPLNDQLVNVDEFENLLKCLNMNMQATLFHRMYSVLFCNTATYFILQ